MKSRRTGGPLIVSLLALLIAACVNLRPDVPKEPSVALPAATDTPSANYLQSEVERHEAQSGFRLLTLSTNALMSRITLADHASHTIDLQYYIFRMDKTGKLLTQRLLTAADRGVRIRLLIDQVSDEIDMLEALDAHPNIEVRLFNPFLTIQPTFASKVAQVIIDGRRLNRRMHNKSFIVDNVTAIVGGRNIGDGYFNAGSDTSFRDLDVVMIGPVVAQASHTFDEYWNADASIPLSGYHTRHRTHVDLAKLRSTLAQDARTFAESDYAQASLEELPNGPTADRRGAWFWGPADLVADQPEKIEQHDDHPELRIGPKLRAALDAAQSSVVMITPYFVPGDRGTQYLIDLAKRGIKTKVLTNSLASTDEPVVHAGYLHYRRTLIEGGVQIYELCTKAVERPSTVYGASSGVSLHAKAFVIDGKTVFIGSMNMDQRSRLLNTEMGVIVDSQPLADAVTRFFDTAAAPGNAYHVVLDPNGGNSAHPNLIWLTGKDGEVVRLEKEPAAGAKRRLETMVLQLLPIDSLL